MPYRVILFDLFGTLVHFKPRLPVPPSAHEPPPQRWLAWLQEGLAEDLPGIPFDRLVEVLAAVTGEIVAARPPEFLEVPSRERFRRALVRLGVRENVLALAERLTERHMAYLADETELPAGHLELLEELGRGYRLGLISNFDEGGTARRILRKHGLDELFAATLISDGFGRRKPHPSIFRAALAELGADAAAALHVGDTLADDVLGARAAGIDVAWIDRKGQGLAGGDPAPTYTIGRLAELRAVLARSS
jgi:HAD superfamily hydrolase (TIGR01549 family)